MKKVNKIIYWIATLWLSLGMVSTAIVQLFKLKSGVDFTAHMGYPGYFITIIAVWKILGVIALLIPKFPLLKEWAYAGFFFVMTGAAYSHIVTGSLNVLFPSLLLLALTVVSWYFRPADRRIIFVTQ
jgi:hypothetical protein